MNLPDGPGRTLTVLDVPWLPSQGEAPPRQFCSATITHPDMEYPCPNRGHILRGQEWYCHSHDPAKDAGRD